MSSRTFDANLDCAFAEKTLVFDAPNIRTYPTHLNQGHVGSQSQLNFFGFRWVRVVSVTEEPDFERFDHVLDYSALLAGLLQHRVTRAAKNMQTCGI